MSLPSEGMPDREWKRIAKQYLDPLIARFRGAVSEPFTASGTLGSNTDLALVDATAGAVTITLPSAAQSANRTRTIKKTDASANAVTIEGAGAETIDGALNKSLTVQWESKTLLPVGGAWYLI